MKVMVDNLGREAAESKEQGECCVKNKGSHGVSYKLGLYGKGTK